MKGSCQHNTKGSILKPGPFNMFTGNLAKDTHSELTNVTGDSNLAKGVKGKADCKNGRRGSQF